MALTPEQVKTLKAQLKTQINQLPEDQKAAASEHIDSMSSEALEAMLKQQSSQDPQENSIFRAIANKQVDSVIISETKSYIAVLELNPITKGHTLIIPKSPVLNESKFPGIIKASATKLATKIQEHLDAKKINVLVEQKFGEIIIELIPEYSSSPKPEERTQSSREDLLEVKKELEKEIIKIDKKPEKIKLPSKKKTSKSEKAVVLKLSKRIP